MCWSLRHEASLPTLSSLPVPFSRRDKNKHSSEKSDWYIRSEASSKSDLGTKYTGTAHLSFILGDFRGESDRSQHKYDRSSGKFFSTKGICSGFRWKCRDMLHLDRAKLSDGLVPDCIGSSPMKQRRLRVMQRSWCIYRAWQKLIIETCCTAPLEQKLYASPTAWPSSDLEGDSSRRAR